MGMVLYTAMGMGWEWDGNGNTVMEMERNGIEKVIPAHLYFVNYYSKLYVRKIVLFHVLHEKAKTPVIIIITTLFHRSKQSQYYIVINI